VRRKNLGDLTGARQEFLPASEVNGRQYSVSDDRTGPKFALRFAFLEPIPGCVIVDRERIDSCGLPCADSDDLADMIPGSEQQVPTGESGQ